VFDSELTLKGLKIITTGIAASERNDEVFILSESEGSCSCVAPDPSPSSRLRMTRAAVTFLVALLAIPAFAAHRSPARKAALSPRTPTATSIGLNVLRNGGNAIDAAVAVSFALQVVHPQAGNIGGGGFLLYYEAATKAVWRSTIAKSHRCWRSATCTRRRKRESYGRARRRRAGTVAGLAAAHERFGTKPWKDLIAPAIAVAREGTRTDEELAARAEGRRRRAEDLAVSGNRSALLSRGKPLEPGHKARTARAGSDARADRGQRPTGVLQRETAKILIDAVHAAGGILSDRDLRDYKPVWRARSRSLRQTIRSTRCLRRRAADRARGNAQHSFRFDLKQAAFRPRARFTCRWKAERRAYIDRNKYVGDPSTNTHSVSHATLAGNALRQWRRSIDPNRATQTASLSEPTSEVAEGITRRISASWIATAMLFR
jgi:gamma-glutamyltranspeptidase/glutathione hydrolase